jgi:serine/threonine protein kinase
LDELYKERVGSGKKFSPGELKYVFKFSLKFVLLMRRYGLVHNDIKPENFTIVLGNFDDKKKKELRIIDLGLSNDSTNVPGFTVKYYMNPLRKYKSEGGRYLPIIQTMDEKFKNEIFTVLRTI